MENANNDIHRERKKKIKHTNIEQMRCDMYIFANTIVKSDAFGKVKHIFGGFVICMSLCIYVACVCHGRKLLLLFPSIILLPLVVIIIYWNCFSSIFISCFTIYKFLAASLSLNLLLLLLVFVSFHAKMQSRAQ